MEFTTVQIITNKPGAQYQGSIWDRFLTVRTTTQAEIIVFDPDYISDELQVGVSYDLVLTPSSPKISDQPITDGQFHLFEGEIRDLHFISQSDDFTRLSRGEELPQILINTTFGNLLFWQADFEYGQFSNPNYKPKVGDTVYWTTPKWFLLAIV